jgi:hypothetical protein
MPSKMASPYASSWHDRILTMLQRLIGRSKASSAGVYERGSKVLVFPSNKATTGLHIDGVPVFVLPSAASDEELGKAVVEALGKSKSGLPHPDPNDRTLPPVCEAVGVKSWSSFARGALYCSLRAASGKLSIDPTRREGSSFFFMPDPDLAVVIPFPAAPSDLGSAVRLALSRCK